MNHSVSENGSEGQRLTPGLPELFFIFFRVGALTIGGGLAMISVLRHELGRKKLISEEQFVETFAGATSIPGAIVVNFAFLHGYNLRGWAGGVFSLAGVVMPSFLIMLIVVIFLFPYFDNPAVHSFLRGTASSVAGLLAYTAFSFGKKMVKNPLSALLALIAMVLAILPWIHPLFGLILVGVAGNFLIKRDSKKRSRDGSD